jgi:Flp pilus assembly protein protease CpaA
MIASPSTAEWHYVYIPLFVFLALAIRTELRTRLIPNSLVLAILCYFVWVRVEIGPEPRWYYLASSVLSAIVVVTLGFAPGLFGGGVAKLTIAVSMAMVPWMALTISFGLITLGWGLRNTGRFWTDRSQLPGSVILMALVTGTVAVATSFGH